jgi:hypothetical protein
MNRWTCLVAAYLFFCSVSLQADEPAKPKEDVQKREQKDSFDLVFQDLIKNLKGVAKLLSDATSADAAKKVKPDLEKAGEGMQKIDERLRKLGQLSKEQEAEMEKKYKPELEDVVKTLEVQVSRLKGEPFGKEVLDALERKPGKPPAAKPGEK